MAPYVRTVKTSSGATAVQIVFSNRRGARKMEHIGSAHTQAELELLKAAARQKLTAGQGELDLGLSGLAPRQGGPLPITSSRMGTCGTRSSTPTGSWGSRPRPATRCFGA